MTIIDLKPQAESAALPVYDWSEALSTHSRWLRTVVSARLGEHQAVDEVMQEISLAAVEQKAPLSDPAKVPGWLYRIAVLKVLMYRRQRGRQSKLFGRYADRLRLQPQNDTTREDPLGWLLSAERKDLVRQAMAKLPGREAEILMLKYSENWSYRQLAEHLGLSEPAIESRLHRARQRLRDELTKSSSHPNAEL
jgi:RNA polymerase sigma-70 factor (ECF subfamily)